MDMDAFGIWERLVAGKPCMWLAGRKSVDCRQALHTMRFHGSLSHHAHTYGYLPNLTYYYSTHTYYVYILYNPCERPGLRDGCNDSRHPPDHPQALYPGVIVRRVWGGFYRNGSTVRSFFDGDASASQ